MADESGDKVEDWQSHGFFGICVMIEVFVSNRIAIILFYSGFTDRWTFEIFAKVVNI